MKIKESFGSKVFDVANIIFLLLLMIIALYPLWHVVMCSFSNSNSLIGHTGTLWLPIDFSLSGYQAVFKNESIWGGFGVSVFVVVAGTVLNILLTLITAYFLSKQDAILSRIVSYIVIFSMYFSAGLIPMYMIVRNVGLYNNIFSLIIPNAINTFYVIIMRSAIQGVPDSLFESAELDGASHFTVVWRIVAPLCLPTIAVLVLYYSVDHWNSWFNAMLYVRDREKFPLQLFLREVAVANATLEMQDTDSTASAKETLKYALIVVSSLPVMCVYPFLQKYFVKGVMVGAVKG